MAEVRRDDGRARRAVEFLALFAGLPLIMALALPPDWLFPVLFAATLLGCLLLSLTPGFAWRALWNSRLRVDWGHVALVGLGTAAVAGVLVWWLVPHQALVLPRRATGLWLMILVLYPLVSALPQELLFRPLFFRRYGDLLPRGRAGILANGLFFALAHLMFWNWVALLLTFVGGLIFAQGYLSRGGFGTAVALHAVCGAIVFTSGLGSFFYHGAIGP